MKINFLSFFSFASIFSAFFCQVHGKDETTNNTLIFSNLKKQFETESSKHLEAIQKAFKQKPENASLFNGLKALLGNILELAALSGREWPVMEALIIGPILANSPKRFFQIAGENVAGENIGAKMAIKFWDGPNLGQFLETNLPVNLLEEMKKIKAKMDAFTMNVDEHEVHGLLQVLGEYSKKLNEEMFERFTAIHTPFNVLEKIILYKFVKKPIDEHETMDQKLARLHREFDQLRMEKTVVEEMLYVYGKIDKLVNAIQKEVLSLKASLQPSSNGPENVANFSHFDQNILKELELHVKYEAFKQSLGEALKMEVSKEAFLKAKNDQNLLAKLEMVYLKVKAGLMRFGLENGIDTNLALQLMKGGDEADRAFGQLKGQQQLVGEAEMPKSEVREHHMVNLMEVELLTQIGRLFHGYFIIRKEFHEEAARNLNGQVV